MKSILKLLLVLAIAHLLAVVAFVGWLFGTGRVDAERLSRVRGIFAAPVAVEAKERRKAEEEAELAMADEEFARKLRELPFESADRADTTIRSREQIALALRRFHDETQRMREQLARDGSDLDAREIAFNARVDAWEKSIEAEKQRRTDEQFRKAVKLVEAMPPKQGKQWMLELYGSGQTETAVSYLDAMSASKAANLLKSFTGEEETKVATILLERVRMLGLESEARAGRTNDADSADQPAETARTGSTAPGGLRTAGANGALELP
jgi:hypothetical protein